MNLGIFFVEDVNARLRSLKQANDRALALALRYGMDAEAAGLCRAVYAGALLDVALSFELSPADLVALGDVSHSELSIRKGVILSSEIER